MWGNVIVKWLCWHLCGVHAKREGWRRENVMGMSDPVNRAVLLCSFQPALHQAGALCLIALFTSHEEPL